MIRKLNKKRKRYLLKVIIILSGLLFFFTVFVLSIDWYIGSKFNQFIYSDLDQIPKRKIALVLGTSKYVNFGGKIYYNAYYVYRLSAAAKLYQAGKVDGILVSGDNSSQNYDEPTNMTQDLIELGIPANYITQDYAGFRTLDSIVRAQKIFGLENYTIVSQKFHCQRALYIAQSKEQTPIAFAASDVKSVRGLKTRLREVLARFKAFLDCQILNVGPKFLGEKEIINYRGR